MTTSRRRRTTLFLLNILFLLATTAADSVADDADSGTPQELEAMCRVLRSNSYNLFCNAIATSDLQVQLASTADASVNTTVDSTSSIIASAGATFTLFAPKDTFLYTLDMVSDAADYVAALRYHIVPNRRLALSDLHNMSSPFLDTLLPHYSILIYKTDSASVTVDGVTLSDPDLYLGSSIAVHGLDGILLNGYSQPFDDCDGENGIGFIPSPYEVNAPNICLNSPAARTALTPTVAPPLPEENRGKDSRNAKRGKHHRRGKDDEVNAPNIFLNSPAAASASTPTVAPPHSAENRGKDDEVNAPNIFLNSTATTPAPTPTVTRPLTAENRGKDDEVNAPNIFLNSPATTPAPTPTLARPLTAENRGEDSRTAKRGKHHRRGIRSGPRRDRRRNNHAKGGGDYL